MCGVGRYFSDCIGRLRSSYPTLPHDASSHKISVFVLPQIVTICWLGNSGPVMTNHDRIRRASGPSGAVIRTRRDLIQRRCGRVELAVAPCPAGVGNSRAELPGEVTSDYGGALAMTEERRTGCCLQPHTRLYHIWRFMVRRYLG